MTDPAPQEESVQEAVEEYQDLVQSLDEHEKEYGTVSNVKDKILKAKGEGKVWVLDDEGHLLLKFDLNSQMIESATNNRGGKKSTKHKVYGVDATMLPGLRMRNIISDNPVWIIYAKPLTGE